MSRCLLAVLALALALALPAAVAAQEPTANAYAGLESREIKSLSQDDIEELRRGGGWGLALPAELNGAPGPAHLLELRDEIGLTTEQVSSIEALYQTMRAEAQDAGRRFVEAEAAIEAAFRGGELDETLLESLVATAEAARADLRVIHLSRHLATVPLLTGPQIASYTRLRGYRGEACDAVPAGHDPDRWRRHNECD